MRTTVKSFLVVFIGVLALLLMGGIGTSYAAVSGPCADCHTMHNSQDGTIPTGGQATPQGHLTLNTCVGCHTGTGVTGAPLIDGAIAADFTAGGTFEGTVADAMSKRHDVVEFWAAGDTVQTATPGNSAGSDQTVGATELTCAGVKGCHGDATGADSDAGITGFHHGSKEGYRYLQNAADQAAITGLKSPTWEKGGATATDHNVYSANTATGISALCANCHGQFHSNTYTDSNGDGTGNWVRHPTDVVVPLDWAYTLDLENNPLAFKDGATVSTTDTTNYTNDGTYGSVACISCHRAHGSAYDDILRFSYTGQDAGSTTVTTGCLGCHSKQRG